jgi:hypothetical protein
MKMLARILATTLILVIRDDVPYRGYGGIRIKGKIRRDDR